MSKKKQIILLLLILFYNYPFAQKKIAENENEIFPFIGLNAGQYFFGNIGACYALIPAFDFPGTFNVIVANEIKFNKNILIGPKLGGWVTWNYISAGFNFVYYTGNKNQVFVFRPEIGAEFRRFRLAYGYNKKLTLRTFNEINTHLVEVNYTLRRRMYFSFRLKKVLKPRK